MSHTNIRRVATLIVIVISILYTAFAKSVPTASAPQTSAVVGAISTSTFPVVRVVDGDTLVARMDGKETKIRLIGINTPETVDPRKPVECFGKEASAKAKELLAGASVRIETDPTQDTYDKYGRLLAYIYLPDGTLFNESMIAEGYAYEYTYGIPYRYQKEFKAAEQSAKTAKKGLWANGVCGN